MFAKLRDTPRRLLADIDNLEDRARGLGMFRAMHALNNAKNVAGWELANTTPTAPAEEWIDAATKLGRQIPSRSPA